MANKYSHVFDMFKPGKAPGENIIESAMASRIGDLSDLSDEQLKPEMLKEILDEIVHASLASDFVVSVLDTIWNDLKENNALMA